MTVDLLRYQEFVAAVTSKPSNDLTSFIDRLDQVDGNWDVEAQGHGPDINVPLLMTAALGLAAETGEFCEIPKKIFFQGKPLNDENVFHMKRELGDIIWYWINACRALGFNPNDVIEENVNKLKARYPGGEFDVHYSENRSEGDL
jgi:NTP pyrophosphatase (non-canonical NTP hydrolase)